jgi:hypothetical protein
MFQVLEAIRMKDVIVIVCSRNAFDLTESNPVKYLDTEPGFMGSKTVKIFDNDDNCFTTNNFILDKTTQCFNTRPISPMIGIKESVPENFLRRGNKVELLKA